MDARWSGIDPRLYFVTDTGLCQRAGRSVAQTAALAVAGGAGIVQVRDKTLGDADFLALTRQVLAAVTSITRGTGRRVPVFVNDRVAVARTLLDEGADVHIHVGQDDWPVAEVRRVLGPHVLIGLSAATLRDCAAARAGGRVDLIGISPAFDTATKRDAGAGLGVDGVRALATQAGLPCVAIGGIDETRAALLRSTGVIGICVVSAICRAGDPQAAARQLLAAFAGPCA
ncbi:MAG TPA: thiamine phosphate synthase [Ottowia sp.]|nr:thiamine phosphate synthase [Ottowia sp.]